MVIALNEVADEPLLSRAIILTIVAIAITLLVYGTVALIVKMDDIGLYLAERQNPVSQRIGRALVKGMPILLRALAGIGIVAMLWVGGPMRALVAADLARREGLARSPSPCSSRPAARRPSWMPSAACSTRATRCWCSRRTGLRFRTKCAGPVAPQVVEPDETLLPSAEAIERALSPRTRAVILNQPSNPTGRSWERARVEHLAGLVLRHRLWLIVDQVYATLIYDGPEEPLLRQVPGARRAVRGRGELLQALRDDRVSPGHGRRAPAAH